MTSLLLMLVYFYNQRCSHLTLWVWYWWYKSVLCQSHDHLECFVVEWLTSWLTAQLKNLIDRFCEITGFTSKADEAYNIGPAAASQSYLRQDAIMHVAKQSGAQV